MSTTISTGVVTARKDHQCDDCGQAIDTGDPYRRSAIAGDSTSWTWKEHLTCAADADRMLGDNWFDTDDWPSQFLFREMQAELHAPAPPASSPSPPETEKRPATKPHAWAQPQHPLTGKRDR